MRVVMIDVPERAIEERARLGIDGWDEVWEGEYHMSPPPSTDHGNFAVRLGGALVDIVEERGLGTVIVEAGIRRLPDDYRVADLAVVAADRTEILRGGWIDGPPDLVVEVRSPGDETPLKVPWYERLAVPELLVVERDTRAATLYRLGAGAFIAAAPDADGWVESRRFPVAFRTETAGGRARLAVQDRGDPGRRLRHC